MDPKIPIFGHFEKFQKVKTYIEHLKLTTRHKFINIGENCDFPYFYGIPSNPVTKLWYKPVHVYVLAETQVVTEFDRSFNRYSYTSHYIHTNRKYWHTYCCLLVLRLCLNSSDLNNMTDDA